MRPLGWVGEGPLGKKAVGLGWSSLPTGGQMFLNSSPLCRRVAGRKERSTCARKGFGFFSNH